MTAPSLATAPTRQYRGFMMLRVTSLRAAHLVLWSSPILLLVLVFTVSSPPTTTAHARVTTPRSASTLRSTTTTTTAATMPSTSGRASGPTPTAPLSRRALAIATPGAPSPTTTVATAPPADSSLVANAVSGALVGDLSSSGATEDVPIQGPGSWLIESSAPMLAQLFCPGWTESVSTTVTINSLTTCRIHLINWSNAPLRWQIVPTP